MGSQATSGQWCLEQISNMGAWIFLLFNFATELMVMDAENSLVAGFK